MNRIICLFLLMGWIAACKKSSNTPPPPPDTMTYIDLHDSVVKMGVTQKVNPDQNSTDDFTFSTRTVNDATLNETRFEFYVVSRIDAYLLMTSGTPTGKKFNKGDSIRVVAPTGTTWSSLSFMIMSQKVTPQSGNPFWQGEWKDALHHFLPIKVTRRNEVYAGWIEITMEPSSERMILHKAAVSIDPDKNVRAGY